MPHPNQDIRNRLLVARLPKLPEVLLKLMEYCQSEDVSMAALAELVAQDPGIASKIIGVANSSAYHRSHAKKVSLEQSLIALGMEMIRILVISESVFQTINGFSTSGNLDMRRYWKHSLMSASIARDIAKKMAYPQIDEAYLAGLLHDVGRLALLAVAPNEYAPYFYAADTENLCVSEQQLFSITHQEASAWLIERWNLDSFMADSVLYHHEPANRIETAHPLIRIVMTAHLLADHEHSAPIVAMGGAICGLDKEDLAKISSDAAKNIQKTAGFLGLDLNNLDEEPAPVSFVHAVPAQRQLNEELHNIAQTNEAAKVFKKQEKVPELLEAISKSACILFNLDEVVIFLADDGKQSLVGVPINEYRKRLDGFSIPLNRGDIIAEVALRQRPAFITNEANKLGIAEKQILRILGTECLVCLPLSSEGNSLGVMIGGAMAHQRTEFQRIARFLQSFANEAADQLQALYKKEKENKQHSDSLAEELRLESLKLSHEISNPLAIVKNYLSLLENKLARHDSVHGEISVLHEEIDRASTILREFANPPKKAERQSNNINRVIGDVVKTFRDTGFASEATEIVATTENQPEEADCDDGTLKQILINLVKNAIEAMPNGGKIEVRNDGHVLREGRTYVKLSVTDNGPGIPQEVAEKIFSPLYESSASQMRGLGLSIVQDLVKKIDGIIDYQSSLSGTRFEVLLPTSHNTITVLQ